MGNELAVRFDDADALANLLPGLVDVIEGALLQATSPAVVFFVGNVIVGLVEKFQDAVEAATVVQAGVNWRMFIEILAIFRGGFLDVVDGVVDLVDGLFFFVTQFATIMVLQMGTSSAKIGQSMKVSRMLALRGCVAGSQHKK